MGSGQRSWTASPSETLAGAVLAASMLAALVTAGADLLWSLTTAVEAGGVALFVAALVVAPLYAQHARRGDLWAEDAPSTAGRSRRW